MIAHASLVPRALRTFAMVCAWYSCEPCEKFMRAHRMPASYSFFSDSQSCVMGPIVQTILVRIQSLLVDDIVAADGGAHGIGRP